MLKLVLNSLVSLLVLQSLFLPSEAHENINDANLTGNAKNVRKYIVRYKTSKSPHLFASSDTFSTRSLKSKSKIHYSVVSATEDEIKEIRAQPDVEIVEEDVDRMLCFSSKTDWGLNSVEAPQLWGEIGDGSGAKICIVDTGIRATHQNFDSSKLNGNPESNWNVDHCGHGTEVAGIIASKRTKGNTFAGIAPGAELYIVNLMEHGCGKSSSSAILRAVQECVDANSKIISLSLSGRIPNTIERDYFAQLREDGIIVIASSGNEGDSSPRFPASYPSVISVGAITSSNLHAWFSTYNDMVDLVAPGDNVMSLSGRSDFEFSEGISGTSYATPHVSGIAALLWSAYPRLSNEDIIEAMVKSALDLGAEGRDDYFGHGLVKGKAAQRYLMDVILMPMPLPAKRFALKRLRIRNLRAPGRFAVAWKTDVPSSSIICFENQFGKYHDCSSFGSSFYTHSRRFRRPRGSTVNFRCVSISNDGKSAGISGIVTHVVQ